MAKEKCISGTRRDKCILGSKSVLSCETVGMNCTPIGKQERDDVRECEESVTSGTVRKETKTGFGNTKVSW